MLASAGNIGEIREIITTFSDVHGVSRFAILSEPIVLQYFHSPNHGHLLDLLAMRPEPALRTHGSLESTRKPGYRELIALHGFFQKQDALSSIGISADNFRQLMIERGWITICGMKLAQDFLKEGSRKDAVDLLAIMLVQHRSPVPEFDGIHRFPRRQRAPQTHLVEEYLPVGILQTLAAENLALEVERAIVTTHGDDPLVTGFLRFFHNPTVEGFEAYLADAQIGDGVSAAAFRIRLIRLLERVEHTRQVAEEIRKKSD